MDNTGIIPSLQELHISTKSPQASELTYVPTLPPQIKSNRGDFGSQVFFMDFRSMPVKDTGATVNVQVRCSGDRKLLQVQDSDSIPAYPPTEFMKISNDADLKVPAVFANKEWYIRLVTQHESCKLIWFLSQD